MGIAHPLVHLHHGRVIYRDLKTRNVLLDRRHFHGITHFGIARFENTFGEMNAKIGRPNYMAPELVPGGSYTGMTDVDSHGFVI
jgi:serine/threonine protein kinase